MHLQEIILCTASIVRTKLFYSKTLELPLIRESEDTITFKAGNTLLTFNAVADSKPFYHFAFNITNNKFSDSFEWINTKLDILFPADHKVPVDINPAWNTQSFYFSDNNGSIIEFISRFDLPYYSSEPFSVADIKEVSEIGVVTDDVAGTARRLNEEQKLPYFVKSKPTDDFTVIGDDYGLLLVVPRGRGWVPNHKPAQIFPLTVVADGKTLRF